MCDHTIKLYHMVEYMVIAHVCFPHVTISGFACKERSELQRWHNRGAVLSPLTPHRSQTPSYLLISFHPKVESLCVCCSFLFLFLAALGLPCYTCALSSCSERCYSPLLCSGFSLWWHLLSWSIGSRCPGLSSCSL